MTMPNQSLDLLLNQWYADVFRFSFLLSCHTEAAREITFRPFCMQDVTTIFRKMKMKWRQSCFPMPLKPAKITICAVSGPFLPENAGKRRRLPYFR